MRSRDWAWWRPLLGLLLLAVVYVVAATVVVVLTLAHRRRRRTSTSWTSSTRGTLLVTNLSLIVAIPVVWLAWVTAHGMRRAGRPRCWRGCARGCCCRYALMALATLGIGIGGCRCWPASSWATGGHRAGRLVRLAALVVLLTTPLQSAAEEYLFRGYLEPGDRRLDAPARGRAPWSPAS